MNFAYELMDLCRGTQEVEAVLSECRDQDGAGDPLARLKMALEYEEKKVNGDNYVQNFLTYTYFLSSCETKLCVCARSITPACYKFLLS